MAFFIFKKDEKVKLAYRMKNFADKVIEFNRNLDTSEVFILGKKNADFISKLNKEEQLFERMTVLELKK